MKSIIFLLVLKSILGHILTDLDNDNKRIDHLQQNEVEELTSIWEELEILELERSGLRSQLRVLQAANRHKDTQNTMFNAVGSQNQCGTGDITGWSETIDLNANAAGSTFANGVFTAPMTGYYFITACFRCRQGSACDIQMRYQGAQVAAMGRRDNDGRSWGQICNQVVQFMDSGSTFLLHETAGGGSPSNCKFNGNTPYSTFNGFFIIAQ